MSVLDNKHANNYYWFARIQLLIFFLSTRLHSSLVEHEYLSVKSELKDNLTNFYKYIFIVLVEFHEVRVPLD